MPHVSTNRFITIEGIEGVGKTTAVQLIYNLLLEQQQEVILTREPGGTFISEQIRNILLTPQNEKIIPDTELLLIFAARCQHIMNVILPALLNGKWVVSDRFVDASYAYQGGGRNINIEKIKFLEQWIVDKVEPHLTILLDAPPAIGLMRAKHRGPHDRIEQEKIDFFERVREIYLERAKKYSDRFFVIDATESIEIVSQNIKEKLNELMADMHHAS